MLLFPQYFIISWSWDCNLPNFISVFNLTKRLSCTVSDIIKLLLAAHDAMTFSPLGEAAYNLLLWILKDDPDFIYVFDCNYTSILYRFAYIQVFLLTWNDVMAFSTLRDAAGDLYLWILRGWPQLCFIDTLCLICPVEKLFHFFYFAGISAAGAFWGCF